MKINQIIGFESSKKDREPFMFLVGSKSETLFVVDEIRVGYYFSGGVEHVVFEIISDNKIICSVNFNAVSQIYYSHENSK